MWGQHKISAEFSAHGKDLTLIFQVVSLYVDDTLPQKSSDKAYPRGIPHKKSTLGGGI